MAVVFRHWPKAYMHPEEEVGAPVGSLFTLEIPVNNEGLECIEFSEKRFGLDVSGKL